MPANPNKLVLTENDGTGEIAVEMDAFFEFSFWMAEQLEDLVAKWRHTTPKVTLGQRNALPIGENDLPF